MIEDLHKILHKYNQLVQVFKTALDQMVSDGYKVVIRAGKRPAGEHKQCNKFDSMHLKSMKFSL